MGCLIKDFNFKIDQKSSAKWAENHLPYGPKIVRQMDQKSATKWAKNGRKMGRKSAAKWG